MKPLILFGAGTLGKKILSGLGRHTVAYFCDNNLAGSAVMGVDVIDFETLKSLHHDFDVWVSVSGADSLAAIEKQLRQADIPYILPFGASALYGYWFHLYELALKGMNIGLGGDFRQSGEEYVLQYLKKEWGANRNFILFDVGANVGGYSSLLLRYFPYAQLHVFEPGKLSYQLLQENLAGFAANNPSIVLNNFGFSDCNGRGTLFYDKEASGLASIYKRQMEYMGIHNTRSEEIELKTLDSYCSEHSIRFIDLCKIDVEGNELNVLKGAQNLIKAGAIQNIQIEFGGANLDSRTYLRDFWNLLHDAYSMYRIMRDGLVKIEQYDERMEIFTTTNFLFMRNE